MVPYYAQGFPPVSGIGTSCATMSWAFKQVYVMFESRGLFKYSRTNKCATVRYGTVQYNAIDDVTSMTFDPKSQVQE